MSTEHAQVRKMWALDGGPPWAVAVTAEDARRIFGREGYPQDAISVLTDDYLLTMQYDSVPSDLTLATDCKCDAADDCECGLATCVTLKASEWAAREDTPDFIEEYDG